MFRFAGKVLMLLYLELICCEGSLFYKIWGEKQLNALHEKELVTCHCKVIIFSVWSLYMLTSGSFHKQRSKVLLQA